MPVMSNIPLSILKTLIRRYKHHYDQVIVDRDNEIQMLRDELASKSAMVHRNW